MVSSNFLGATPDYQESTSETLLGANSEAFAVRRVENNNQGNYYISQEKVFIDEYNKVSGKLLKSTLLIDKKMVRDIEHNDPNSVPKVGVEITHKDAGLKMSDLYEKYSPIHSSWQPDYNKFFTYTDNGILFKNHLLIGTMAIDKLYKITFNHGKAAPKILSIQYHGNSIYIKITTRRSEEGVSSKMICLSPKQTRQVYAWANMNDVYLKVASFETLKEANVEALKIHKKLKDKKQRGYTYSPLEIWSMRLKTNQMKYVVVLKYSKSIIDSNKVENWSNVLSASLIPISSKRLLERWAPHEKLNAEDGGE